MLLEMRIALAPNPPFVRLRVLARDGWKHAVVLRSGRAMTVALANRAVLRDECRGLLRAGIVEKPPQVPPLLERRAARGTLHSPMVVAPRAERRPALRTNEPRQPRIRIHASFL